MNAVSMTVGGNQLLFKDTQGRALLDDLKETLFGSTINLKSDATTTGKGFFGSDGLLNSDNGWDYFMTPIWGAAKCSIVLNDSHHPSNYICEFDANGNFIRNDGTVRTTTFVASSNARFIGIAYLHSRISNLSGTAETVSSAIGSMHESVDGVNKKIETSGLFDMYSMTNAKTARPLTNVPAGTTIYFRTLKTTNNSIDGLTMYGLNTGETAVSLDSSFIGEGIVKVTTSNDYEYIQVSLHPWPESFEGTVWYEIYVSSGYDCVTSDIFNLQKSSPDKNLNQHIAKIFRKVTCIGDSYTAGYINLDGEERTIEPYYAWPHYMETSTGNTWVNCGVSGANVLTWQTAEDGYQKCVDSGRSQAYVIGLLINDISNSERGIPLGTPSDIGTDAQTYYGGMSKLITRINALNPLAKIFVNTCPAARVDHPYNEAIRYIVDYYSGTIPVHCIDLVAMGIFKNNPSFNNDLVGGHYTGIGYEQMAEGYEYALSKYIGSHVSDFQNVHHIPFDEVVESEE